MVRVKHGLSLTDANWLLAHLFVFFNCFIPVICLPPLFITIDTLFVLLLSFTYVFSLNNSFLQYLFVSFFYAVFVRCCNLSHLDKKRHCTTWSMFSVESISACFWISNYNGEGVTKLICQDHSDFPDISIHWLEQKHLKRMIF